MSIVEAQAPKPSNPVIAPGTAENNTSILNTAMDSASSSNIFAKISWVIIIFILFLLILRLSVMVLSYFFNKTSSPHIIDGMVSGKDEFIFQQDPSSLNAKTIAVSNNQPGGLEFTWSVWIYINSIGSATALQTIFTKGDGKPPMPTVSSVSNSPGLFLDKTVNKLIVAMNTISQSSNQPSNELSISNIPLSKWLHIVIRCTGNTLDVYVNGIIANSKTFINDVPQQNFGNVNVATNGGFDGYISNLWYYDYSLSSMEIQSLLAKGPNTNLAKPSPQNSLTSTDYNYLSTQWYL
jgi:hypothetical protein